MKSSEDVITPVSSAGSPPPAATAPLPAAPGAPQSAPPADPVKAATERGDFAEMNRLMNERKRDRRAGKSSAPQPSPAVSATARPVTVPDSGAGNDTGSPPKPETPEPGSKEFNFRELEADRNRWKAEAEESKRRLYDRPAPQAPAHQEPAAAPINIPFKEPRPDWNRILDTSVSLDEAIEKYGKEMETWLTKRDAARDREIQSRTRQTMIAEGEQQKLRSVATAIREKVDALAKTEGFEDLPELYRESQSPYTEDMLRFYAEDEHGARVMHYMILNPGQAQELTMLPPKLLKQRLADIRESLIKSKPVTPIKQTTDAPSPIRKSVTGRTEAPSDPLKSARDEGQKTGDWRKFNAIMNERKRTRLETA